MYWTSYSAYGNPPKSWIVFWILLDVIRIPGVSQWAEIDKIAFGFYSNFMFLQYCVKELVSIAFIGLPCPKKIVGIVITVANILILICKKKKKN